MGIELKSRNWFWLRKMFDMGAGLVIEVQVGENGAVL
jgi:hypothetical protein